MRVEYTVQISLRKRTYRFNAADAKLKDMGVELKFDYKDDGKAGEPAKDSKADFPDTKRPKADTVAEPATAESGTEPAAAAATEAPTVVVAAAASSGEYDTRDTQTV